MTDQLLRLGYLADAFSKMNKVNLSVQEKQLIVIVNNDKYGYFKPKSENLYPPS